MEFLEETYMYIGTNGRVAAIDPEDGKIVWQTTLNIKGSFSSFSGQDVNLLYQDGLVYAGVYGHIFCLDAVSGDVIWHNGLKGFGYQGISIAMKGITSQVVRRKVQTG